MQGKKLDFYNIQLFITIQAPTTSAGNFWEKHDDTKHYVTITKYRYNIKSNIFSV